jgi:hypothetical protein
MLHYPTAEAEFDLNETARKWRQKYFGALGAPVVSVIAVLARWVVVILVTIESVALGLQAFRAIWDFFDDKQQLVGLVLAIAAFMLVVASPFVAASSGLRATRYFVRKREIAKLLRERPSVTLCEQCAGWGLLGRFREWTSYAPPPHAYPIKSTFCWWVACGDCGGSGIAASQTATASLIQEARLRFRLPVAPKPYK